MSTTVKLANLNNSICPLCGHRLAGDEYKLAITTLKKKVSEEQGTKLEQERILHQRAIEDLKKQSAAELKAERKKNDNQRKVFERKMTGVLEKNQSDILKATTKLSGMYERKLNQINKVKAVERERFQNKLKQKMQKAYDNDVKRIEKKRLVELKRKETFLHNLKSTLNKEYRSSVKTAVKEAVASTKAADIVEISDLKRQVAADAIEKVRLFNRVQTMQASLSKRHSEIQSAVGERDLTDLLRKEFPKDDVVRGQKGMKMSDIIQTIVTPTGQLGIPIVYDNKEAKTITKSDIEKAIDYKGIHKTNYVLIVSRKLPPKYARNGRIGFRRGVMMLHPDLVPAVARVIRDGLIEISKLTQSEVDQQRKEEQLYDYVRSQEFTNSMKSLDEIHREMVDLQLSEERAHSNLWSERKGLVERLRNTAGVINSKVTLIVQGSQFIMPSMTTRIPQLE